MARLGAGRHLAGQVWGRFGAGLGQVWGRFGAGLGQVWGSFGPGTRRAGAPVLMRIKYLKQVMDSDGQLL